MSITTSPGRRPWSSSSLTLGEKEPPRPVGVLLRSAHRDAQKAEARLRKLCAEHKLHEPPEGAKLSDIVEALCAVLDRDLPEVEAARLADPRIFLWY